jgi:Domain of unknown function (DUF6504)
MLGTPGDPVEVWLTDGRPGRFVWRGRMYTVMLVLDHESRSRGGSDAGGSGCDDPGADRECWRVEATPLHTVPPATYELCRDNATDRWSLLRT